MINTRYLQLIKFRDTLGMSVIEAAKYVGYTTTKEWIEWESNKVKVPNDVSARIERMLDKFNETKHFVVKFSTAENDPYLLNRVALDRLESFPEPDFMKTQIAYAAVKQALAA